MKAALAELMSLDRQALAQRWQQVFGHPAPLNIQEMLLRQALGWQLQADAEGGISNHHRRQLLNAPAESPAVGARLIRVWQGETHQVMVLADGYAYRGKQWKSLSAIARAITGTPWSGPVFFGLKK